MVECEGGSSVYWVSKSCVEFEGGSGVCTW